MPVDNYAKPILDVHERLAPHELFFFDSKNPESVRKALDDARAISKPGRPVVIWKPLDPMPPGVRCVGHAPHDIQDRNGRVIGARCLNCGGEERNWGELG